MIAKGFAFMVLSLYDTLSSRKRPFEPIEAGRARVYICGPTVYDYPHLGHVRCYVVYDVLVRHLRQSGLDVTYVRNITDIDDKIIQRAKEAGEAPGELARRFTAAFYEDMHRVGVLDADIEPKVSEHLPDICQLIQRLIDKGAAYRADGDVYFSVQAFPEYGKLSHRKPEDLLHGASGRLDSEDAASKKRHPADFALWKGAAEAGEASYDSPWGAGRPGWHVECSAMSMRYLGESFDLHGGGLDLVFPHHENEIAQSEAATAKPFARLWMHNGFIEVDKEKMSKSLGNFFTAREAFRFAEPEALRYFVMTVHYRAPLNLDWLLSESGEISGFPQVEEAERRLEYLYTTRERLAAIDEKRIADGSEEVPPAVAALGERLREALDDDLNMPVALAALYEFLKQVNELAEQAKRKKGRVPRAAVEAAEQGFERIGRVLGLGQDDPQAFLRRVRSRRVKALGLSEAEVEERIQARRAARQDKDFARADAIRDELAAQGIELMDSPAGTTWRLP